MYHLILLLICILSVEIFILSNILLILSTILKITRKIIHIIFNNNISDHWKERVILSYSLTIMKCSIQVLLILLFTLCLFLIAEYLLSNFLYHVFSFVGVAESIVFTFGYLYLRKLNFK